MIDTGEVDDKIVAVLKDDSVCDSIHRFKTNITLLLSCIQTTTPASSCCRSYGHITTLSELPSGVVDRLRHYFLTCAPPLHT